MYAIFVLDFKILKWESPETENSTSVNAPGLPKPTFT
jgi:hypothetical protein